MTRRDSTEQAARRDEGGEATRSPCSNHRHSRAVQPDERSSGKRVRIRNEESAARWTALVAFAGDLAAAGVDLILCETMNTVREARAAARAAAATGLPTIASFVCGTDGRLLSGERVADAAAALLELPVVALAINCTPTGALAQPLQELLEAARGRVPCGAYGNVGKTDAIEGFRCTGEFDAEAYAAAAMGWVEQGAWFIGGCCGTGPEHIAAVRKRLNVRSNPN